MRLREAEKKINGVLLHLIIGFSFIADSKEDIGIFLKKQVAEIIHHLIEQYKYFKGRYIKLKIFLIEAKEKSEIERKKGKKTA